MNRSSRTLATIFLAACPAISYFQFERPVGAPAQGGQRYVVVDEAVWQHALPGLQDLRHYSPAISYFQFERPLSAPAQSGQHYAVVDETVWQHALPGLQDLRLYSAGREIPYTTRTMRGGKSTEMELVRVLGAGSLNGKTQFLLDMEGSAEYDRVILFLKTRNYVAHARVDGQDDPHGKQWADLGTTTLFDLSDERLGRNSTLKLPLSSYKYLRVTIDGPVKPSDVELADVGVEMAQEDVWRDLPGQPRQTQEGHDTVLSFSVPQNTPVERVMLAIDPAQGNFQRGVGLQGEGGDTTGDGKITRIHMQRNGSRIDFEQTMVSLGAWGHGQMRIVIHNGDDAPLRITRARLQQYERRIYFDCDPGISLALYYGDQKLDAPVYDYAKLFQSDVSAVRVQMGGEEANAGYTGRPDERPWSERHPGVLWAAILAAVAILGGIAVRSIKSAAA
jgi:hypothetical protein